MSDTSVIRGLSALAEKSVTIFSAAWWRRGAILTRMEKLEKVLGESGGSRKKRSYRLVCNKAVFEGRNRGSRR